jgi:hypothetical protein
MGTNATIARKNENGTYTHIYVHFDGYLIGGVGETLHDHFQDSNKVDELIALGDLSSLKPDITTQNDFDNPNFDATIAYHRDRGEELEYWESATMEELLEDASYYLYIYEDGRWFFRDKALLSEALQEVDE